MCPVVYDSVRFLRKIFAPQSFSIVRKFFDERLNELPGESFFFFTGPDRTPRITNYAKILKILHRSRHACTHLFNTIYYLYYYRLIRQAAASSFKIIYGHLFESRSTRH